MGIWEGMAPNCSDLGWNAHLGAIRARGSRREGRATGQNGFTPDICLLPGGVTLPFDGNLLDIPFSVLLPPPSEI